MNNTKHIPAPVYTPTASSIWTSFLASGKKHLVITGQRQTGKTTLVSHFPISRTGIITWAEPGRGVYMKESLTGESVQIGAFDPTKKGDKNLMTPCINAFTSFGTSALSRCAQSEAEFILIDEIGYLEASIVPYTDAIVDLMAKKRLVAVLRKQDLPFLNYICTRDDVFLVDLDLPQKGTSCIIMASGLGKRFGSNKLLTSFSGKPLIEWIMDSTEGIFEKRVVVTRHEEVCALAEKKGIHSVFHSLPHRNDTIRLGLEAIGDSDFCVFCPGDQPLIKKETLTQIALIGKSSNFILRTKFENTVGMPTLFPSWAFNELKALPEGMGGNFVIKNHPDKVHFVTCQNEYELKDIDTVEDFQSLEKYITQK